MKTNAGAFHERHNLQHFVDKDLFIRAALVAKDPDAYEDIEGLTAIERAALAREQSATFWQQFKLLTKENRIILVTCCIAAVAQ